VLNPKKGITMKHCGLLTRLTVLLSLVLLMFPRKAFAYLDPGTGSYILQLVLAALFGASFAVRIYFKNVKSFIGRIFSKKKKIDN